MLPILLPIMLIALAFYIFALAFYIFALVDCAMTDASRTRGVSKPVWIVLVVFVPIIGAILWLVIGKVRGGGSPSAGLRNSAAAALGVAADEVSRIGSAGEDKLRSLEERLRELDNEIFPGEKRGTEEADTTPTADPEGNTNSDPDNFDPDSSDTDNSGDDDSTADPEGGAK